MGILKIKSPRFRKKLFLSNRPYWLKRPLEQGEQDLFDIVKKARREENWVYFPEAEAWISYNNGHEEKYEGLSVELSLLEETPFGNEQIYYHIHPLHVGWIEDKNSEARQIIRSKTPDLEEGILAIMNSVPSPEDFLNSGERMKGHEMRVVSNIGVYSLKGLKKPQQQFGSSSHFLDILGNGLDIETLKRSGVIATVERMVKAMNTELQGYLSVSFRPKPKQEKYTRPIYQRFFGRT